jgi:hypothetical protein
MPPAGYNLAASATGAFAMRLGVIVPAMAALLIPVIAEAHNCKCRNRGVMFGLGETSCLHVDGRSYLARCEMKLNVSSWTEVQDGCPVVDAAPLSVPETVN